MNRPYGAVDVAANLKGAVSKTAAQKILVALAEKGELVQKTYGRLDCSLFVSALDNLILFRRED
jgi:26S proteasome regulatory subunit (ATPase 3-interacting protein)